MFFQKEFRRPEWVFSLLADSKSRIAYLLNQIVALGPPGQMKPHIYRYYLYLLSFLSYERDKKRALIEQGESMRNRLHAGGLPRKEEAEKSTILHKFLDFLSQVANEQEKENKFISRIESVEKQHHLLRLHNRLERVNPAGIESADDNEQNQKAKRRSRLWWFLYLAFMLRARA